MPPRSIRYVLASALAVVSHTARSADGVPYNGRFPAKFPEAAKLTSVAVLPFTGPDGADFAEALSAQLRTAMLDGKPYFSVRSLEGMIGKSQPAKGKKAQSEQAIDQSNIAYAIVKGRQLGVDAVYVGRVTIQSLNDQKTTRNDSVCAKSKSLFKCESSQNVTVNCNNVSLEFSVVPKAIRVRDGEVVYSETVSGHGEYSRCDNDLVIGGSSILGILGVKKADENGMPAKATTPAGLVVKIRADVADRIRRAVAPYNKTIVVQFKKVAPELPKTSQPDFKSAVAFAEAARLDRACGLFQKAMSASSSNSPALLYNLGACAEALDPERPDKARSFYQQADDLLTRPDKLISAGLDRTLQMTQGGKVINVIEKQNATKPKRQ